MKSQISIYKTQPIIEDIFLYKIQTIFTEIFLARQLDVLEEMRKHVFPFLRVVYSAAHCQASAKNSLVYPFSLLL